MELWIRSQDRENLVKVDRLTIDDTNSIFCDYNDFYLGTYETKERALEVLDDIQNILKPKTIIKFDSKRKYLEDGTLNDVLIPREEIDYIEQLSTYVYEMPNE